MSIAQEFFKKSEALFQAYQQGKYADALAVAERLAVEYPERDGNTSYWRICLYAVTGQKEQALRALEDALKRGVWWAEEQLRSDPDLASLQNDPQFERLLLLSNEKQKQARAESELFVYQPDGTGPFPLLIALHGRYGNAERDFSSWKSAIAHGWTLAMPQSSQPSSSVSFVWDDRHKAMDEIAHHLDSLIEKYPIDNNKVVLAGFSQGAARAIELVMSGRIRANGFLAVVPGPIDLNQLGVWADSSEARGVLISGGRDPRYEMFQQINAIFSQKELPLMFENYPEMPHVFPDDFEKVLQKGLEFIMKREPNS